MGCRDRVPLCWEGEAWALVPRGSPQANYQLSLPEQLNAPVRAGQHVGSLRVSLGGETLAELPLLAAEEVPRLGFWGILRRLGGSLLAL